ncbi:retention module-containing protein [Buttiauxella sp. A2-C2_NF]|uniref:retention module-containing protein n=1 Tax=Buttiauxella ferragutiae TaxID=82989 RepID=UPI001E2DFCFC|nr:retention module-containing protein [Buttiauxella ferragutiae]
MSNLLGVIKAVIGQVYVIEADGSQRLLKEGDRIYSGEEIVTGASGAVSVALPDGKTLDLGRNSHWTEHGLNAVSSAAHDTQDVAALQKAIADGADPTQSLEATAAGNQTPVQIEGGGGGHTLVQLDLTAQIVDPTAGFNTQGLGAPTWEHNLPEGGLNAGSPPVLPPQVHIDEFAGNDGYVNKNEINHAHISGTSNQKHVTLTFTDSQKNTLTFEVDVKDGHWTADPDLTALAEGEINVIATATDISGRTAQSTTDALIDTVDLHDTITIDDVTADNVINIAESHEAKTSVHGTVGGDAKLGDKITLLVNGHEYSDVVIDLGNGALGYRIDVLTPDLLTDPNIHATVTSTDEAGNTTQASSDHHVDLDFDIDNSITIETIANDDIVNRNESRMPTMVTGVVGGDAQAGDPVMVTVGGRDFHGVVVNDNGQLRYEIPVPSSLLQEGNNDIQVQVTSHDAAGNEATAIEHKNLVLDTQAEATVTIDSVTKDNVLNHSELGAAKQWVHGTVGGDAREGDAIDLEINGKHYSGKVIYINPNQLGYQIAVEPHDFSNNKGEVDGFVKVSVSVISHDAVDNEVIEKTQHKVQIDNHANATITIDDVTKDNVLNHDELNAAKQFVHGNVGGDARVGDVVDLDIRGNHFTGTVVDFGNGELGYNIEVDSAAFSRNQGEIDSKVKVHATIKSHDDVGNVTIQTTEHTVYIDNHANATITIDAVTKDNILNHDELAAKTQFIHGVVGGDAREGDVVDLVINGTHFRGEVIAIGNDQLGYNIPVNPRVFSDNKGEVDGFVKVIASVKAHDAAGNEVVETTEYKVQIDNHANATINIEDLTDDNILNHNELSAPKWWVHGVVDGDAAVNDRVDIDINGNHFTGEVFDIGNGTLGYRIPVDSRIFSNNKGEVDDSVNVHAKVTSHDAAGNVTMQTTDHTVYIDNHANATLTIDDVTADNILNHAELDEKEHIISGVGGGDAKPGDEVVIEVNGMKFTGYLENDLSYHIAVPSAQFADNNGKIDENLTFKATITSHDLAHNEIVVTTTHTLHIDNFAVNDFTIDTVAGEDWVSKAESQQPVIIRGDVTGADAKDGDPVVVRVAGVEYSGEVKTDAGGHLYYEVPLPAGTLHDGLVNVEVSVTSHDALDNYVTTTHTHDIAVDTKAAASIHIDKVTVDNVLNHDELAQPKVMITGWVDGDAAVGDKIVIEVHGIPYPGKVIALDNGKIGFRIEVDSGSFSDNYGKIDTDVTFKATITSHDILDNEVTKTTTHTVHIDNHAVGNATIDLVTGDNVINHLESKQQHTHITGTITGEINVGDKVFITVNNISYETTVIQLPHQNGALGYSLDVVTKDLLADPYPTVHVVAHDAAGNENHIDVTYQVDIDLQAEATINIDPVAGDDKINADESTHEFTTVSGTVGGDVKEGDYVHLVINGNELTAKVTKDGNGNLVWTKEVSTHDLMVDPHFTASVTATDNANNVATAQADRTVEVDTKVEAVITIDKVSGDDTLNGEELNHHYTLVSGTLSGEMKPGDEVVLKINGHDYPGKVEQDANGDMVYHILVETTDLHQDPNIHASITVEDDAHNVATATAYRPINIDDHADASLTINTVSGDDTLNQLDQKYPTTTVYGSVGGEVHQGDVVHVFVNGHEYTVKVEPQKYLNGGLGYSVEVKTSGLVADGHIEAFVSTVDNAGNTITVHADHDVKHDDQAVATITIDKVTDDDVINNAEAHQPHTTITGQVTGDVHLGDQVTLDVNGVHYYGDVIDLGTKGLGYSIEVSTDDLISKENPTIHASVTGYDEVGNTVLAEADHDVVVDTRADVHITDDRADGDNENGPDHYYVTGRVTGLDVQEHDHVLITIGDKTFDTEVIKLKGGGLGFNYAVSPSIVYAHPDIQIEVTSTDKFGNTTTAVDHIQAHLPAFVNNNGNTTPPDNTPEHHDKPHAEITISPIAGNDVVNQIESEAGKTVIRGTVSGDVQPGDHVMLHIGTQNIEVEIKERPNLPGELGYEIAVDTQYLMDHPDISVSVNAHNEDGKTMKVDAHKTVQVDTDVTAEIHLDTIAGDDIINIVEAQNGVTTVTGTVKGDGIHDGSNVTLMINGHQVTTQVHTDSNGELRFNQKVSIADLRQDPHVSVSVTAHDDQGNTLTVSDDKTITVDTDVSANIFIDMVTDDNILNLAETQQPKTTISGYVSGDVKPHEHVTLNVNGVEYKDVEIDDNLKYSLDVLTDDLKKGDTITAQVTGHDDAHNITVGHATQHYSTDLAAAATLTINTVSGDNILSAKDLGAEFTGISGTVGGDAAVDDKVTVILNGIPYDTKVIELPNMNGQLGYSLDVKTDDLKVELQNHPDITVTVSGKDDAGNDFSQSASKAVSIDDHAVVTLTFDNVTQDNILNLVESGKATTEISGKVTGDVKENDKVILTVNGHELPAALHSDGHGGFIFKLDVATSELLADQTITYRVTGEDDVGNTLTVVKTNDITIDQQAANSIHIDTLAGDDKVNAAEHSNPTTLVTGTITGDAQNGDTVTLTLNGTQLPGVYTLHDGLKTFEIPVDNHLLKEGENKIDVTLTGQDKPGNVATSTDTHHIELDTHADAVIALDKVTGDNHIDGDREARHTFTHITGHITGEVQDGDQVTAMINGKPHHTNIYLENGEMKYDLPVHTSEFAAGHNNVTVIVTAHDASGNQTPIYQTVDVTVEPPRHSGDQRTDVADKAHHAAAHDHGLSNLFDDSHEPLTFALHPDGKGLQGGQDPKVFTGKDDRHDSKHDLSSLAHELHEVSDIAQLIKGGAEPHGGKGDAANPTHSVHSAGDMGPDSHGSSHYSLDHLIAKPEHITH